MDSQQHHPHVQSAPPQAGTSSTQNQNQSNPKTLIFPPNQQGHLPSAPISGSNDLLSLFNLSSMYDWYVKPYQKPVDQSHLNNQPTNIQPTGLNGDLKGKGKADLSSLGAPSPAQLDNLTHKRVKMEKSYGHFVADVGGRNSIKKDHQLESWIVDPNFQESQIQDFLKPFSNEVLSKSFTLKPGILEGFDSSIWVAEEGGPKKKRKKRKQGEMLAGGGGEMNATGLPQGTIPHQQTQLQNQPLHSTNQPQGHHSATMNAMSTHPPPSAMMISNQQPVSSTMTNAKNHQIGTKPNRNVLLDPNQHMNPHRSASSHSSNLSQTPGYPHPHLSNDVFYGHEDHRKKKRTKISNTSSHSNNAASGSTNAASGSTSGSSNHQLAMKS